MKLLRCVFFLPFGRVKDAATTSPSMLRSGINAYPNMPAGSAQTSNRSTRISVRSKATGLSPRSSLSTSRSLRSSSPRLMSSSAHSDIFWRFEIGRSACNSWTCAIPAAPSAPAGFYADGATAPQSKSTRSPGKFSSRARSCTGRRRPLRHCETRYGPYQGPVQTANEHMQELCSYKGILFLTMARPSDLNAAQFAHFDLGTLVWYKHNTKGIKLSRSPYEFGYRTVPIHSRGRGT